MEFTRTILEIIEVFFVSYLIGYAIILMSSIILGSVSIYERKRKKELNNIINYDKDLKISIIVPAYNEEITIIETIESLVNVNYKDYEIIIVDDESKDNTSEKVIKHCNLQKIERFIINKIKTKPIKSIYEGVYKDVPIILVKKENGGKADSLNVGVNVSDYPWFICIDADSILQEDALQKIVQPIIEDTRVIALGGAIMINNGAIIENGKVKRYDMPKSILASLQAIEYNRTFLASRIMFDKLNANLIISGAFGAFRKDVVIATGGYEPSTRGEDMELVIKLHRFCIDNKIDYIMKYVPDTICWTQAPEKLRRFN
ncbi:MAG TPA: glycosyltransferase family 2 protein [Clostridiaceae bacterium]|mgnify:FL=1|nr:glycosyltransferase family 2 protein [Clostridiaceae bacterium]